MTNATTRRSAGSDGSVIVGGGLAAQRCAETLRREGYDGPIRLVCAEAHRPYDRPPLSKQLLSGAHGSDSLHYRSESWYPDRSVDLILGVRAVGLDVADRRVRLSDGTSLHYDRLLIATGGRARMLAPLVGYANVSTLRTIEDALALRECFSANPRLVLVGAGFVGLEIAATARALGLEVTVIEAAPTPLAGILGVELGGWFTRLHEQEGVRVLTGRSVDGVTANGTVRSLRLSDGAVVPADQVVVGVGIAPEVEWLAGSGLDAAGGVRIDAYGRTQIPGIYAAGDAASTFDRASGRHLLGSHWEAAARQGARVARLMLGLEPGGAPITSFWTDQYGLRIQYLGDRHGADAVEFEGDRESRSFSATFTHAGRAIAALLVNRPRSLHAARAAIEKGRRSA